MNPINLYEAYTAVYDEELRDELEVIDEDLSFIDDLSDNELTQIMEEILRDREVSLNECYYAFDEEVLNEARVTTGAGYGRDGVEPRKVRTGSARVTYSKGEEEQRARVGRKHAIKRLQVATGRAAERIRSGAESAKTKAGGAISALAGGAAEAGRKGKAAAQRVGGKLAAAKERIGKFVQAQGKRIGDAKQQAHVGLAKYASRRNLMPGAGLKTRSSKGRSELRGAVASDVAQRAITKPGREVEKAKSGLKGLLRRGAEKVAQRATSFAQRMSEELELVIPYILEDLVQEGYAVNYNEALHILESMSGYDVGELAESYLVEEVETDDLYDVVLEHLLDEGYAETIEDATTIMANMSEEWRDEILDEAADNVIMTVKSPSGKERSKIRKGATIASDHHRHEKPEEIAIRRFSQKLSDAEREREERMRAGRLTVATKRGIERATNRSDRRNEWVPGSSSRTIERDELPTDYRARRRRASGR